MNKNQANSRMLGKLVKVVDPEGDWAGEVVGVKNEDTFLVKRNEFVIEVSMFDIRNP
jgi:hypothetical protein